jgi:hypothetical protein
MNRQEQKRSRGGGGKSNEGCPFRNDSPIMEHLHLPKKLVMPSSRIRIEPFLEPSLLNPSLRDLWRCTLIFYRRNLFGKLGIRSFSRSH